MIDKNCPFLYPSIVKVVVTIWKIIFNLISGRHRVTPLRLVLFRLPGNTENVRLIRVGVFMKLNLKLIIIGLFILLLASALRIWNLTSWPIFADESIYIRWSQVMRAEPSLRFLPLSDGKQPLYMWATTPFLK